MSLNDGRYLSLRPCCSIVMFIVDGSLWQKCRLSQQIAHGALTLFSQFYLLFLKCLPSFKNTLS